MEIYDFVKITELLFAIFVKIVLFRFHFSNDIIY